MIILDTSFIVSLLNEKDPNFEQAELIFSKYRNSRESLLVNEFVIQELATLANIRFKNIREKIFNLCAGVLLEENSFFVLEMFSNEDFFKTFQLSIINKNLSFTDNSIIQSFKKYKGSTVLSFDKDLLKKLE